MPTLKIHKKSRFQPNEEIFAESCSVRYKDLFRAKKIFGVIGTLNRLVWRSDLILLVMAALFGEVFVPCHRAGVLFAGPRDAFSVGKVIIQFFFFRFSTV